MAETCQAFLEAMIWSQTQDNVRPSKKAQHFKKGCNNWRFCHI